MPRNLFTAVTIRRRSAAHGCAIRAPRRAQRCPGGGRDDQVDVGFGQDSGAVTGEYGAHTRAQNVLSHIFSKPGSSPVRWSEGTTPGEPGTGVYGSDTGVNLL